MVNLLLDNNSFTKVNSGAISHLVVCKEEGIKQGDFVFLSNSAVSYTHLTLPTNSLV